MIFGVRFWDGTVGTTLWTLCLWRCFRFWGFRVEYQGFSQRRRSYYLFLLLVPIICYCRGVSAALTLELSGCFSGLDPRIVGAFQRGISRLITAYLWKRQSVALWGVLQSLDRA